MGELCLSRARPDTVAAVFEALERLAPSPARLLEQPDAEASINQLGIGARAATLLAVARKIGTDYSGIVPDEELALRDLPGVGDNIAQAVLCFGYGRKAILLDAASGRLVERFCGRSNTRRWQVRLDLIGLQVRKALMLV